MAIITRIWHGKTHIMHSKIYLEYLKNTGIRDYCNTPGNLSAKFGIGYKEKNAISTP